MNTGFKNTEAFLKVFEPAPFNFRKAALEIFRFQYEHNEVYHQYCRALNVNTTSIDDIETIPFLPIGLFKTHKITTTSFLPQIIFESSGTTQNGNSKHFVKDASVYVQSFTAAFKLFYGNPKEWCIIALLPSYLERNNSSLVVMAGELIRQSEHPQSGFYLDEQKKLCDTLRMLEKQQQKTLLIGVTFALLDFAEKYPVHLQCTVIMETGGMKGRREELTRQEVHAILQNSFGIKKVHSEYGMTELLSQAYSKGDGIFNCPPWMKILLREEDDPLCVRVADKKKVFSGAVNIIDLANIYSCSFIATDDAATLHCDENFEILGRLDNSDIRGCSLLTL